MILSGSMPFKSSYSVYSRLFVSLLMRMMRMKWVITIQSHFSTSLQPFKILGISFKTSRLSVSTRPALGIFMRDLQCRSQTAIYRKHTLFKKTHHVAGYPDTETLTEISEVHFTVNLFAFNLFVFICSTHYYTFIGYTSKICLLFGTMPM